MNMKKQLSDYLNLKKEFHSTKNGDLKPEDFTHGSDKRVWWQCPKVKDHEWEASIAHRTNGRGCPICSGLKASKSINLLVMNSLVASDWHPTKNGNLKPENFRPFSNKKVWWQCPKNKDHEWETIISNRSKGSGCPYCSGSGTSQPEIRILCELKHLIGSEEVLWKKRIDSIEIDIFIPKHNIGIEYDGHHWHKELLQTDIDKNEFFKKKNIQIIRVRENPLQKLSKSDVIVLKKTLTKNDLNNLIIEIKEILEQSTDINFDEYINNSSFLNEDDFNRFVSFLPSPPPEYSILNTHPDISQQWHSKKNNPLKPENFTFGSDKRVWWQCPKNKYHEWQSQIKNRCRGNGCPYCSGNKTSPEQLNLL